MSTPDFSEVVQRICAGNGRFHPQAYSFVRQALDYTLTSMRERGENEGRSHISGERLLEGIRAFSLERFGPMVPTVFDHWGIETCRDFGEIVFELVDYGVLGKTDEDSMADFEKGYDFYEVFGRPFLPKRLGGTGTDLFRDFGEE